MVVADGRRRDTGNEPGAAGLDRLGNQVTVFNQRAELHDAALVQRLLPPSVRVLSMADRPRRSYWAYKLNALG